MSLREILQKKTYDVTKGIVDQSINEAPNMTPEEQRKIFAYFEQKLIQAAQNGYASCLVNIFKSWKYSGDKRTYPLEKDDTKLFGTDPNSSEEIVFPLCIRKWYYDIMTAIRGMNDETKKLAIEKCNLMFMHFLHTLRDMCQEIDKSGVCFRVFDNSTTEKTSLNGPIILIRTCGLEFSWKFPMTKEISDQTEVVRKREREYVDATMHLASLWESEIKKNCVANE